MFFIRIHVSPINSNGIEGKKEKSSGNFLYFAVNRNALKWGGSMTIYRIMKLSPRGVFNEWLIESSLYSG